MKTNIMNIAIPFVRSMLINFGKQNKIVICLAIFSFCALKLSAQNLVQNGGFELASNQPPNTPAGQEFLTLGGANTLTNWTFAGTVDLHNFVHRGMGAAPSIANHIDLNTTGSVSQTITGLTTGATYNLSFLISLHNIVNCWPPGSAATTVTVGFTNMNNISAANPTTTLTVANQNNWVQLNYSFVANGTQGVLSFSGAGCSQYGGGMIDEVSLIRAGNCDSLCEDKDWFENGTTRAPMLNTVKTYRIGDAAIGTDNPAWNFKLVVDNRDNLLTPNNNRNAIQAIAMHTNCSSGYGIMINTNVLGGTKALAVQGDGVDRALIFGNGMSWFRNRMTIGGTVPTDGACDIENPAGTRELTVFGSALASGGMWINSDTRFKENIGHIENTAEILKKLNPVTYSYKTDAFKNRNFPSGMTYGFLAQELKEALPYTVSQENDGYYSVNYIAIIPVLTQAIKEQQQTIDELKARIATLAPTEKTKVSFNIGSDQTQKLEISKAAMLFQNNPNPLNDITLIDYYLPETVQSAFIKVIDNNGKLIQAFTIHASGYGQLELNCSSLASGTYHYSLITDGRLIDTKTMVISKN